jgi:hypothetical protein
MSLALRISLPGNDTDSGDVNLAFSSQWPVLRIIHSGQVKVLGELFTTIPHNLSFTPMIITWSPTNGFLNMPRQNVFVDSKNVYWSHPGNTSTSELNDTSIMVFDIDIEKAFNAPIINASTSSSAASSSRVGIRLTKENKDTSSRDLRDYILHSSARSPLLHAVIPNIGNTSYTHNLPYNPIFIVFAQQDMSSFNGSGIAYVLLNNFAGVTTKDKTISISGQIDGYKNSIVILKDPFYIDSNVMKVTI